MDSLCFEMGDRRTEHPKLSIKENLSSFCFGDNWVYMISFTCKIGEVAAYLHVALYEVQEQYKENKEFTSKIDKCLEYLYEPSLEDIDKCIEEAWVAFRGIGLYAG